MTPTETAAKCRRMIAAMCDADGVWRQGVTYGEMPVGMRHRINVSVAELEDLDAMAKDGGKP